MKRLVFIACPAGKINKAAPLNGGGSPVIRLLCSGNNLDLAADEEKGTLGDKVSDDLLDSMLEQAKAGKVALKRTHEDPFPMGWSYGGEIKNAANGIRVLFVDFNLDMRNKDNDALINTVNNGNYEPQCSIGLMGDVVQNIVYDSKEGGKVGMLQGPARFDHVAFTQHHGAANPIAGIETMTAKSLAHAAKLLKGGNAGDTKMPMQKDEMMAKLADLDASREQRVKAIGEHKDDMVQSCKAAGAHAQGLADMGKEVLENKDLGPDDLRAYISHLQQENAVIAQALSTLGEGAGDGAPEEAVTPNEGDSPATDDKARSDEGAAAGPATPASPVPPSPPDETKKDSPPSTDAEVPDTGKKPEPGDGTDAAIAPTPEAKPETDTEKVLKSLKNENAILTKSLLEMDARQKKLEATIVKHNLPFAIPSREQLEGQFTPEEAARHLTGNQKQKASGEAMGEALVELGKAFGLS